MVIIWYNTGMDSKKDFGTSNTEMVTISRAEYENMQAKIDWLTEQLLHAQKKVFGTSSEKADEVLMDQLSLIFNEAEAYADGAKKAEEKEKVSVSGYSRQRKQSGSARDILPENTTEEVVEHRLPEEERLCPECGELMMEIGKEVVETVKVIPAQYILRKDIYYTYACRNCEENGISIPVVKTTHQKSVISGGVAAPETVAYLMTEKYVMHSPLYRLEQDLKRKDVKLSRQRTAELLSKERHTAPNYSILRSPWRNCRQRNAMPSGWSWKNQFWTQCCHGQIQGMLHQSLNWVLH